MPELREAFTVAEPPTSRIDLDRAMRDGATLRRRRRTAAGMVAGVAVLAVLGGTAMGAYGLDGSTSPAPPDRRPGADVVGHPGPCRVRELPLPKGVPAAETNVSVADIDPTGRYIVGSGTVGNDDDETPRGVAILWVDGVPSVISVPGSDEAEAEAVNRHGVVVGHSDKGAWRYQNGRVTFLAEPHGTTAAVVSINAAGDIVGNSESRPVLWPADRPDTPVVLEPPGPGSSASVVDVADDGTVVGVTPSFSGAEQSNRIVVWRDGRATTVGKPGAHQTVRVSGRWLLDGPRSLMISVDEDGPVRLWDLESGAAHRLRHKMRPLNLNAHGAVVGFVDSTEPTEDDATTTPVVQRGGRLIELPRPKGLEARPQAISDDGVIVGNGSPMQDDRGRPLIWTGC